MPCLMRDLASSLHRHRARLLPYAWQAGGEPPAPNTPALLLDAFERNRKGSYPPRGIRRTRRSPEPNRPSFRLGPEQARMLAGTPEQPSAIALAEWPLTQDSQIERHPPASGTL